MKVLHVIRSDGFAGVERHIATLASAQARSGHEVTVIGGDPAQMIANLDTSVRSLPGNTFAEVVARMGRHPDTDIVHAHMTAGELAASLTTRRPMVVTRHFGRTRGATPVGRVSGWVIRRRVAAQIAISEYVAQLVEDPATVIYPGVPSDEQPPQTRRPVVLVVQRLQPEKNTDIALRAFAEGSPSDWTLDVVGRGPELEPLKALAVELGVAERVSFLGFRDDVPDLMRTSAMLIAPCEIEGLGLSVLESMAHALPVIASRAGAHPETVGATDRARLFEPGCWQQAGGMLADLAGDARERETYGSELAQIQKLHFTPAAQAEATDAVYEKVL